MSTGLTSKQKLFYSVVLTAGIIYAAYVLFFSTLINNTKNIETECATLQTELNELKPYVENRSLYIAQINKNNTEIKEAVDSMLPTVSNQDLIAYDQYLEDKYFYYFLPFDNSAVTTSPSPPVEPTIPLQSEKP